MCWFNWLGGGKLVEPDCDEGAVRVETMVTVVEFCLSVTGGFD